MISKVKIAYGILLDASLVHSLHTGQGTIYGTGEKKREKKEEKRGKKKRIRENIWKISGFKWLVTIIKGVWGHQVTRRCIYQ